MLLLHFLDLLLHLVGGRLRGIGALSLFANQFLINQSIKGASAILVGEMLQRSTLHKGLVADGIIPIALQDDVAIDGGDDAVDDVGSPGGEGDHGYQKKNCELGEIRHQKA